MRSVMVATPPVRVRVRVRVSVSVRDHVVGDSSHTTCQG